jgi:hypothetical protein
MNLSAGTTFKDYVGGGSVGIIGIINTVIVPVILALAFLVFIWGVVKYFFIEGAEEKNKEDGKKFVMWGLLGIVFLLSVWGFVNLLLSTLGIMPT